MHAPAQAPCRRRHPPGLLLLLFALLPWAPARAEQKIDFPDWEVHWVVLNTLALEPDVAAEYGLVRAGDRALVNLSLRRKVPGGGTVAHPASVSGEVENLVGQIDGLDLREIREERFVRDDGTEGWNAIYYLGTVRYTDQDVLRFRFEVRPFGERRTLPVRFQQRVWTEADR